MFYQLFLLVLSWSAFSCKLHCLLLLLLFFFFNPRTAHTLSLTNICPSISKPGGIKQVDTE